MTLDHCDGSCSGIYSPGQRYRSHEEAESDFRASVRTTWTERLAFWEMNLREKHPYVYSVYDSARRLIN